VQANSSLLIRDGGVAYPCPGPTGWLRALIETAVHLTLGKLSLNVLQNNPVVHGSAQTSPSYAMPKF